MVGLAVLVHFPIPVVSLVPAVLDDLDTSLAVDGVEGGDVVHVAYADHVDGAGVLGSHKGAPCSERVGERGQRAVQQVCIEVVRAQVVQGFGERCADLLGDRRSWVIWQGLCVVVPALLSESVCWKGVQNVGSRRVREGLTWSGGSSPCVGDRAQCGARRGRGRRDLPCRETLSMALVEMAYATCSV